MENMVTHVVPICFESLPFCGSGSYIVAAVVGDVLDVSKVRYQLVVNCLRWVNFLEYVCLEHNNLG